MRYRPIYRWVIGYLSKNRQNIDLSSSIWAKQHIPHIPIKIKMNNRKIVIICWTVFLKSFDCESMRGFLIFLLITVAFTENLIQFHGDESSNWSYDLSGIGMTKSSPSLDIKKLQSHLLTCLLAGINGHSCVFLGDDDVTRRWKCLDIYYLIVLYK